MAQGRNARLDESLGMRRGKESGKMQSYKARRDESRGMSDKSRGTYPRGAMGPTFDIKDNTQEGEVRRLPTSEAERYDMGRVRKYTCGSKGYPAEAWDYKY